MSPPASVADLAVVVWARIGDSDCEELGDGLLAQPVNTLTSFAYVLVAAVIAVRASTGSRDRGRSYVYAACVAAIGLGSVAFHGPQPAGARIVHDLPILITAIFILVHDAELLIDRFRHVWLAFAAGAVLAVVLAALSVDAAGAATGLVLVAVVGCEYVVFRRRLRPIETTGQIRAYLAIVAVAAVAGASWLLGRTDGPVCDPDSAFQFHGLWHVVSAVIFALWWWLAFDVPVSASTPEADAAEHTH